MATRLDNKRIAFLVAPEGIEQTELTEPWKAVEQAGRTPELVSTEVGKVQAFNHLTPGANWVDEEVVTCSRGPNTLVSSSKPDDLVAFCNTLVGRSPRTSHSPTGPADVKA